MRTWSMRSAADWPRSATSRRRASRRAGGESRDDHDPDRLRQAVYFTRPIVAKGGLISYGSDPADRYRQEKCCAATSSCVSDQARVSH